MRPFALIRRLTQASRRLLRLFPRAYLLLDRLFRYRREYQITDAFPQAQPRLFQLEPRLVPSGATIAGTDWYDANANYSIDSGETLAAGVTATVYNATFTTTAVSGGGGSWSVTGLNAGTYTLQYASVSAYGYDTPAYGIATVAVIAGEYDASNSAGLIDCPTLDGEAWVGVRGVESPANDIVGTLIGQTYSGIDATIEWGDGSESSLSLVPDTGSTYLLEGQHEYDRAGDYPAAIWAAPAAGVNASAYAEDFAAIVAPTDGTDPEMVAGYSLSFSGSTMLGVDATADNIEPTDYGFANAAAAAGTLTYSFSESIGEPTESLNVGYQVTLPYSMSESESESAAFVQPNSGVSVTGSETYTVGEADNNPSLSGTDAIAGSDAYTYTGTGTGASYTWAQTGAGSQTATAAETTLLGTYSTTDTYSYATAASGEYNFTSDTLTVTWSGSESSHHLQVGYAGPDTYTTTETATGTITGTETGILSSYSRLETIDHDGTYTLSESITNAGGGGTASGTGTYADTVAAADMEAPSGTHPAAGSDDITDTTDTSFYGSGSSTLDGIASTLATVDRYDQDTVTALIDQLAGTYTVTAGDSVTGKTVADTTRTTVEAADGLTATHVLSDVDTASPETSYSGELTGTITTGYFSLTGGTSDLSSDTDVAVDDSSATGTATAEEDDVTSTDVTVDDGGYTLTETGYLDAGVTYTLTAEGGPDPTTLETTTETVVDQPGDGEDDIALNVSTQTETEVDGQTYTTVGDVATGGYSETLANTSTATLQLSDDSTDTATLGATAAEADGGTETSVDIHYQLDDLSGYNYYTQIGNDLTGSFTRTGTEATSEAEAATDTVTVAAAEANGATDTAVATDSAFDDSYSSGSYVLTENWRTGAISMTETDSGTGTEGGADSGNESVSTPAVGSDTTTESGNGSATYTDSATYTISGNAITDSLTTTETDQVTTTAYGGWSDTEVDDPAAGGYESVTATGNDSTTDTLTGQATTIENDVTGSLQFTATDTDTQTNSSSTQTVTDNYSRPDGETGTDASTDTGSGNAGSTETLTQATYVLSGLSTDSDQLTQSSTETANSTDAGTEYLVDGSYKPYGETGSETASASGSDDYNETFNAVTGDDNITDTASGSVTDSGAGTGSATEHLVDSSTDRDTATDTASGSGSEYSSYTLTGNDYSESTSELDYSSASATGTSGDTINGTDTITGGSSVKYLYTDSGSSYLLSTSSVNTLTNGIAGTYSQSGADTASVSETASASDTVTDYLAWTVSGGGGHGLGGGGSTVTSTDSESYTDNATDSESASDTFTLTGSMVTDSYSERETGTDTGIDSDASTATLLDRLEDGTTNTGTVTDNASDDITAYATATATGNGITGSYTLTETGTDTGTAADTTGDTDNWNSDAGTESETQGTQVSDSTAATDTGNFLTGSYTLTGSGASHPTVTADVTDQSESDDTTATPTESWTTTETGNSVSGSDTTTTTDTTSDAYQLSGTDARGTYTGTATDTDTTTTVAKGNANADTFTTTVSGTDTATATQSGGSGVTYSQTVTSTDTVNSTTTLNVSLTWVSSAADNGTTIEAGSGSSTGYSFTETDGQTTTETGTYESYDGDSTVTDSTATSSSLSEDGSTDATDSYVLNKTASGYHDATSTGNAVDGRYTLSGSDGSSSTAIETNTHGTYGATFTEILGAGDTFAEKVDDNAAEYSLSNSGTNSDTFNDVGTDMSGTYTVTEGSAGSFTSSTQGQYDVGDYTVTATNGDTYSYTEVMGGSYPFTEIETGSETVTASTANVDTVSGLSAVAANGVDKYTLTETGTATGGTFAETVTGTDSYFYGDSSNSIEQTDTSTTTGGGSWNRTVSGPGATLTGGFSSNSYTLTSVGNALLGSFTESESGGDRYALVQAFDNVANTGSGSTPGNVTFHGTGVPFRDPGGNAEENAPGSKPQGAPAVDGSGRSSSLHSGTPANASPPLPITIEKPEWPCPVWTWHQQYRDKPEDGYWIEVVTYIITTSNGTSIPVEVSYYHKVKIDPSTGIPVLPPNRDYLPPSSNPFPLPSGDPFVGVFTPPQPPQVNPVHALKPGRTPWGVQMQRLGIPVWGPWNPPLRRK